MKLTPRPYQLLANDVPENPEIKGRLDAKKDGDKYYFTGTPCKYGHVDIRWTCNGTCVSCHLEKNPPKGFYGKTAEEKKEKSSNRARRWYEENKEKTIQRAADWKRENPEKMVKIRKDERVRRSDMPEWKSISFMRGSLRRCLKNKKDRTEAILGYTRHDLVKHLELLFEDGMSWDNYGEWEIDHIVPVSWFVRYGVNDPRVVNKLNNLRPLWAFENRSRWRPRIR